MQMRFRKPVIKKSCKCTGKSIQLIEMKNMIEQLLQQNQLMRNIVFKRPLELLRVYASRDREV